MTAKYDFFLTPQPKEKQEKTKYHARVVIDRTLGNQEIATEISKRCTINKAEAMAVMDEMQEIFRSEYSVTDGGIQITVADSAATMAMDEASTARVVAMLLWTKHPRSVFCACCSAPPTACR